MSEDKSQLRCSAASELDALRWRQLPAHLEEFQIDYVGLKRAIDADLADPQTVAALRDEPQRSASTENAEYQKLAEARIARQGRMLGRLRKAIKPFADIALAQDADTAAPDMIEAVDLAISPSDVRAAREAFNNLDADFLNEPQGVSQSSAGTAPVAWRWRSIFNETSWLLGDKEPPHHEQFITEPLYTHAVLQTLGSAVLETTSNMAAAVENLARHQEQCDMDGVMVKVSRQALDEVLSGVEAINSFACAVSRPKRET